jgi:hypothetical protein
MSEPSFASLVISARLEGSSEGHRFYSALLVVAVRALDNLWPIFCQHHEERGFIRATGTETRESKHLAPASPPARSDAA